MRRRVDGMRRSIPARYAMVIRRIHRVHFLRIGDRPLKKNSNSQTTSGQKTKPAKARGPVQRDSKDVMAELVAKLSERLEPKPAQEKRNGGKPRGVPAPNRDRLM